MSLFDAAYLLFYIILVLGWVAVIVGLAFLVGVTVMDKKN